MKNFRLTLLGATAFLAAPLYAQDSVQTPSEEESYEDIVVTALGIEQPKSDAGVSISVLNGDDLERRREVLDDNHRVGDRLPAPADRADRSRRDRRGAHRGQHRRARCA